MIYGHVGTTKVRRASDGCVRFGTRCSMRRGYIVVTGVVYRNRFVRGGRGRSSVNTGNFCIR
jgi:hypothetical protein